MLTASAVAGFFCVLPPRNDYENKYFLIFSAKNWEKFWWFKKKHYLCIAFRESTGV